MDIGLYYDAQTAVLGSLMIDPAHTAGEIFYTATPEDFSDPTLRNLFTAARNIWREQKPLDPVTLLSVAGEQYSKLLAEVMRLTPTAANYAQYLEILTTSAQLDRLRKLGAALQDAADLISAKKLLQGAEDLIASKPRRKRESYGEMISDFLDRMNDSTPPDYLDFGIRQLNSRLHVSAGQFVILGSDSSMGKTALAFQIAVNIALSGKRVGFASYETTRENSIDRIMANRADIDLKAIKEKKLSPMDIQRVVDEGVNYGSIGLEVFEAAGCTVNDLRTEVLARRLDVLIVDYIQIVPSRRDDRWQAVTEVSMALHSMAQQLGVVVFGLSQVTPPEATIKKKGEPPTRRMLSRVDLRESRQLLNDADVIIMMDLVNPNDPNSLRVLKIDKNKDGACGMIFLEFDPQHMRFAHTLPPPRDSEEAAAQARAKNMDANKAEKQAKEQKKKGIKGQCSFKELPNDEPLPFR